MSQKVIKWKSRTRDPTPCPRKGESMRSAIVGCGAIANLHGSVISKMDDSQLVAVADIKREKADEFSKNYKNNKVNSYGSLEEMLEAEEVDVLHICTPHYLHVPMAIYALENGVHVFMEKPPAISREQFALLEESKRDGELNPQLGICFQNRYNHSVKYIKELLSSEQTGKILGARVFVTWCRGRGYYENSDWKGSLEKEGGGVLINQAIHSLDLLVQFLGKAESAEATMSNRHLKGLIDVEDTIEAYIKFEDSSAVFYATSAYCSDSPVMIELACENLTIRMETNVVTEIYKDGRRKVTDFSEESVGKDYWGNGHLMCINNFYKSIKTKKPFPINLEGVKDTFSLMMDIYDSARNGTGGQVPCPRK